MALILNFSTCVVNGCTQIKFTETTGVYSASNIGGYGAPNNTLGSITTAVLTITSPSLVVYTINLFPLTFPSSNSSFSYTIPTAILGLTTIVDGKWTFTYTVSDGITTFTTTKYSLFYCNSECCITQKLANLELTDCDCCKTSTDYDDYILAWTYLQSLKDAAECGNVDSFTKIKKIIDKLCLNNGCKTCK